MKYGLPDAQFKKASARLYQLAYSALGGKEKLDPYELFHMTKKPKVISNVKEVSEYIKNLSKQVEENGIE